jgi:predicted Zn-dependent peptidase
MITVRQSIRVAGLLLVAAAAPALAQYPTDPPPAGTLAPLRFPPFGEARVSNGLQLVVVENHRLPIVSIQLSIPTGAVHDPQGQRGLAEFTAELLTKGTATRTADQFSAEIEGAGGSLTATAGQDFFTVSSTVLADRAELAFSLIGDVLLNATFPETELELARRRTLSGLQVERSQPDALADRYFARAMYGGHPYGARNTEASVKAITQASVKEYAATYLKPVGSLLVVAGDITLDQARQLADRHLAAWRGQVPPRSYGAPPLPKATEILLVHRPGSEQANIVYGNLGLRPGTRNYYPSAVMNKVLGGGADSRLFLVLREQKGWTYGAYSSLSRPFDIGTFQATAEVRTAVTDSALAELLAQLGRIRTESVPDSEITSAKGYLTGVFPLTIETPQQIAGQVGAQKRLRLGDDYLERYRERIAAVKSAEITAAAARVIRPDSAVIVVVGDGAQLHGKLAAIAPVKIVDVDGNPLVADDLNPRTTAVSLDPAQLVARRDSFAFMFQGNAMGSQVTDLREEAEGMVYVEQTSIPVMGMTQMTQVRMAKGSMAPQLVEQSGQVGGQNTETKVTIADGRASGRAQSPQQGGLVKTVEVDTTIATGTFEVNQLQAIVPALPLAEGASITLNVFNASDATTKAFTFKVEGVEDVTVPAGTFPSFRVSLTGGDLPVVFLVSRDTPRRVVKIEIVGQPVVFELVK